MFVDEKLLTVKAGKGGDGAALFRREKYAPRGGPDGGDGGNGGSVYIVGKHNLHTLVHLAQIDRIEAENGAKGGHQRSTGKSGQDTQIGVPLGTLIYRRTNEGAWMEEIEITQEGEPYRLVKGGNGGWGNWHFRSSVQQAPERFNPGLPGEAKELRLVLKLIADVGLVGLPNAGKSTFLASVTAAKPKIANYPFTTLEPQLGVAWIGGRKDTKPIVIADLPGLIEGASQGKGLGRDFLKHIERTKQIIHCLAGDASVEELKNNYETIRKELLTWSKELSQKPELIALTKSDLLSEAEISGHRQALKSISKHPVFAISAVTGQGLTELLTACL